MYPKIEFDQALDYPLSGKFTIAMAILITLALTVPRILFRQGVIGGGLAVISSSSALLIFGLWIARKTWQAMPSGEGAESKQSRRVAFPFESVCKVIFSVVSKNHWKMLEADEQHGQFKAKIGLSAWTISQTISIQVSRLDDRSVKADVKCKAYRAPNDHGQNDKMIAKFYRGLEKSVV